MNGFASFRTPAVLACLVAGLMAGCSAASVTLTDPEAYAQLPRASPDADIQVWLISNEDGTTFYVDGDSLVTGRRVKVLINNQAHTIEAKHDEYKAKEMFVQGPHHQGAQYEFHFMIQDRLDAPGPTPGTVIHNTTIVTIHEDIADVPEGYAKNDQAVALVIGVQDYLQDGVPDVTYAKSDAKAVREYLVKTLGYKEYNILPEDPDMVITAGAFKTLVREKLPSFLKEGRSDVFVFFSGHGAPGLGANNEQGYLVPADTDPNFINDDNAYRFDTFYEDLARLDYLSLTIVLDACFSGFNGRGQTLIREASSLTMPVRYPVVEDRRAAIFTASAADEVANWYSDKQHGMFTYFFLRGLQGEADLDGNDSVTVGELESYLTDPDEGVPYWSRRKTQRQQVPQVSALNKNRVLVRYK